MLSDTLRRCPYCKRDLPLSEFGLCNARPDKKNLYCMVCVRKKIAIGRQELREYKAIHKTPVQPKVIDPNFSPRRIARLLRKLAPNDRVYEAIRCGADTQDKIIKITRLPKDDVCAALANLLLWSRSIGTAVVHHQRIYFVSDRIKRQPIRPREPRSYGVSTVYFAA